MDITITALRNRKAGKQKGLIHTPLDDILKKEEDLQKEELQNYGDENMTNPTQKLQESGINTPATFKPVAWIGLSKGGKGLTLKFDGDKDFFVFTRTGVEAVLNGSKKGVRVSQVIK
jgi:hypothetical protein